MHEVPLKVAVRLRPLVGRENVDQLCIRVQPDRKQIILGKDRAFTFDYIFPPDSDQVDVFQTLCVPLIKQCFQGQCQSLNKWNLCCIARPARKLVFFNLSFPQIVRYF